MVFFDIDGTLLNHKQAEHLGALAFFRRYRRYFPYDETRFYELWVQFSDLHFKRYLNGEISFEQQRIRRMQDLFKSSGIRLDDDDAQGKFDRYLQAYADNWHPYHDVIPCLKRLKGRTLGIITNGELDQQRAKLQHMGIEQYFSLIVAAGDIGIGKPDTRIFRLACARAGRLPEECIYIGDNVRSDILPCLEAGMDGIWLNRNGDAFDRPVRTVFSLSELVI